MLSAKRERCRADVCCLLLYAFQQIGYIFRIVKFRCQCEDVSAFADAEVIPFFKLGVYLERGFRFLPERGFIPQVLALLLYRRIAQTLQIVCQFDLLYILDCPITYGFEVDENLLI